MEIKYLQNVNVKRLPNSIRVAYDKISKEYETKIIMRPNENRYNEFTIHRKIIEVFYKKLNDDTLFTSLHPNTIINNPNKIMQFGFKKIKYKDKHHLDYYKILNEEYLSWLLAQYYRTGFLEGYKKGFNSIENVTFEGSRDVLIVNNIFNTIYLMDSLVMDKCNLLYDDYYDIEVISPFAMYEFGKKEGEYIRAWDTILSYPDKFKKLFDEFKDPNLHLNTNIHPEIFSTNGFILFDRLMKKYVRKGRGRNSDIAYYYRRMDADNFIKAKITPFKFWLYEKYPNVNIDQIKTLSNLLNDNREINYTETLEWLEDKIEILK